jgi:hypothetical protein
MRNFEDVQRDYHFSYSGADCRVYASEENGKVSSLRSLSTASVSVHEAKAPVRALGRRSVVGFTESIRTIAGSLVFVLVNDHPLAHLENQKIYNKNWSKDRPFDPSRQLSTLLNPINLYFVYKTEISKQNSQGEMLIKGVRFINEGIVTSVNDMVTEIVMQFVAEDIVPFEEKVSTLAGSENSRETIVIKSPEGGLEPTLEEAEEELTPALKAEEELTLAETFTLVEKHTPAEILKERRRRMSLDRRNEIFLKRLMYKQKYGGYPMLGSEDYWEYEFAGRQYAGEL